MNDTLTLLVFLAGVGQLCLALGSLAIPYILGWPEETKKLKPMTREVFWTYAGYIWCTNISMGLLSALSPEQLVSPSTLSLAISLYITIYWGARVAIQFFYFDRTDMPKGRIYQFGETSLVLLFVYLTLVYGSLVLHNLAVF